MHNLASLPPPSFLRLHENELSETDYRANSEANGNDEYHKAGRKTSARDFLELYCDILDYWSAGGNTPPVKLHLRFEGTTFRIAGWMVSFSPSVNIEVT